MNTLDSVFNERLLKEIAELRKLKEYGIVSDRIEPCLELLRVIRNTELKQGYEKGVLQENEWIEKNKKNK